MRLVALVIALLAAGPAAAERKRVERRALDQDVDKLWAVGKGGHVAQPGHAQGMTLKDGDKIVFRPTQSALGIARAGQLRSARQIGVYLTSKHLGLRAAPHLFRATYQGQEGTGERYHRGTHPDELGMATSSGANSIVPAGVAALVAQIDWDSLHAVAILHYVTANADGHGWNIFTHKQGGKLRFWAVDAELSFANAQAPGRTSMAIELIREAIKHGAPTQLSRGLQKRLANVDVASWQQDLAEAGLGAADIAQAVQRLQLVQQRGLQAVLL